MSFLPAWRQVDARPGEVVAPDERLPWPQTVALGVQHVIAMFGATVLAPILMGFDPNVAILMSGIGTLIFLWWSAAGCRAMGRASRSSAS